MKHPLGMHGWHREKIHTHSVSIEGKHYAIDADRRFWVTPGKHEFHVCHGTCVHGPGTWFQHPAAKAFAPLMMPAGQAKLDAQAGREYVLEASSRGMGSAAIVWHSFRQVKPPPEAATQPGGEAAHSGGVLGPFKLPDWSADPLGPQP